MNSTAPQQHFTLEEANKRLPLVKAIVKDITALYASVADRRERLERLRSTRGKNEENVYSEELEQSENELRKDAERLQEFVEELHKLGAELKDPERGLVDFRSQLDGREVLLCWQAGEEEIGYWHEIDAGFEGRQSLLEKMGSQDKTPETDQNQD